MSKKIIASVITVIAIVAIIGFSAFTLYKKDGVYPQADYSLIDMYGNKVDENSYLGKKQIVFFGYTFCPDICPTTLQSVSKAFDEIDNPDEWVAVLVTIDPKRDTADILKEYVGNFHKNITAYTGSEQAIADMAEAFQARYNVSKDTKDDKEFYLMEHTAFIYYINTDGSLSSVSLYNIELDGMLSKMKRVK